MFLDSVTDRIKELLVYIGLAFYWANYFTSSEVSNNIESTTNIFPLMIITLGLSLLVSYLNAWGEVVSKQAGNSESKVNSAFRGGFAPYQVRITLLGLGLIFHDYIALVLVAIAALSLLTVITRFANVWRNLE